MTKAKAIEILNETYDGFLIAEKVCSDAFKDEITDRKIVLLTAIDALKAEPVKHGRWEVRTQKDGTTIGQHNVTYCSECGYVIFTKEDSFCARCGARMDGDEDGDNK